ncbi:MAG TPA: hypothetical protein VI750_13285 [Pyrinomonadaceae bacterium]|nr:hypothetical protein [Pyrinomonadaceae bacterium]
MFAGAVTRSDRSDLEAFRRAVGSHILPSQVEDWLLAGRCLARYSAGWGKIIPRDHLADVLIAVTAAKLNATVASENVFDMVCWKWVLKKLGFTLQIGRLEKMKNE